MRWEQTCSDWAIGRGTAPAPRSTATSRSASPRLEEAVQENRALNVRLAELTDVVTELLLPVAARDEERLEELLGKYRGDFS